MGTVVWYCFRLMIWGCPREDLRGEWEFWLFVCLVGKFYVMDIFICGPTEHVNGWWIWMLCVGL